MNPKATRQAEEVASHRSSIRSHIDGLITQYFDLVEGPPPTECPLAIPLYGAEEVKEAVAALLDQNVTMGTRVRAFEASFASWLGSRHAIMLNSGSSANLLALAVLSSPLLPQSLRSGDEVIVPAVTWPTTVTPILQHDCVPVLVDIDLETLNLNIDSLSEAMSSRTRAVMPVHLLGNPVPMGPLMDFAKQHGLWVVEDTCESLGSSWDGRRVGSIGDIGTFSFYFSHHITTIEGGMLVTDDDQLANLARSMRAHGWTRDMANAAEHEAANPWIDPRFLFVNIGYNLRPTELQAAFGIVQLAKLEAFNEERRANARYLINELSDVAELQFVTEQTGGDSTWFGFAVFARDGATRRELGRHLESRGVATRPIVAGNLAHQPAFRDHPHRTVGSLANATEVSERGLFIGNHPGMTQAHLDHVVSAFREFYHVRP